MVTNLWFIVYLTGLWLIIYGLWWVFTEYKHGTQNEDSLICGFIKSSENDLGKRILMKRKTCR